MKKLILCLLPFVLCTGCVGGSLQLNADNLQGLQSVDGKSTSGCVATNLNGSSGVIGGNNRSVITWGTLNNAEINWCIGK